MSKLFKPFDKNVHGDLTLNQNKLKLELSSVFKPSESSLTKLTKTDQNRNVDRTKLRCKTSVQTGTIDDLKSIRKQETKL